MIFMTSYRQCQSQINSNGTGITRIDDISLRSTAMVQVSQVVLFILTLVSLKVQCQLNCLRTNSDHGPPRVQDYLDTKLNSGTIPHHHQVIITSYKFDCSGNITEWRLASRGDGMISSLQFQVWRPSLLVETNGCYRLVGSNRLTTVILNNSLVVTSPLPEDRIEFLPGDVLGFYVEGAQRNETGVVMLYDFGERGDKGYETEEVWHGTVPDIIINPDPDCLFNVGPDRYLNIFTTAAPTISVSYQESHQYAYSDAVSNSATQVHPQESANYLSTIIIGATATTIIAVLIAALFIITAIYIKGAKRRKESSSMVANNEAHEVMPQNTDVDENDTNYDYPIIIDTQQNAAYATITARV